MDRLFVALLKTLFYPHLHDHVGEADSVMLAPALIEHHPEDDAGVVAQLVQPPPGLSPEPLPGLPSSLLHGDGVSDAGEVLPHQQAQPVCPVVPSDQ